MGDPVSAVYYGVPGLVVLWAATVVSFSLLGWKAWQYIALLRKARPENRFDKIPQRIALVLKQVFGQQRILKEGAIGPAHFLIFWAFVFFATTFFWNLLRGLFPFLPVPYPDEVPVVKVLLQAASVFGLVGLAIAAVRRYFFTPPRLERSGDATFILSLIASVLITSLVGSLAASETLVRAMWWAHMFIVLGFMAYLPFSKHLHLLASTFGVFFAALSPTGMPPPSEGAVKRDEFTWRELFCGLACAECGRCDRVCPVFNGGYPLSPKELMHRMRELVREPGAGGGALMGDGGISKEAVWSCTTCMACMERCPVFNEHIPLIVELRRKLVAEGDLDASLQDTLVKLNRYGNSFGVSPRARTKWTQGLAGKLKDIRKEAADYLWFVGDYASFDPRIQPITRATAQLFQQAGVDFGILYEAEQNSGNDVRRVGEEGLFEALQQKNLAAIQKAAFKQIVTTDPHTYQAFKHEYPWTNGNGHVVHYTELLDSLIQTGRLEIKQRLDMEVTYHDPCYLGRYNNIYDAPRRVLTALGLRVVEMPRNRDNALCCGAGGGRIWMEDAPGIKERPAESRVREAAALNVKILVVACPKDLVMFQDAVKTTGLEGKLEIKDLAQLVEQAVRNPERSSSDVTISA